MKRSLLAALGLAALTSSCIIHVEADGHDPELALGLYTLKSPAIRALADDLDDAGWEIEDMDPRGHRTFEVDVEAKSGHQDATLRVELGHGRDYTIKELEIDADEGSSEEARDALRSLADPEELEVLDIDIDTV